MPEYFYVLGFGVAKIAGRSTKDIEVLAVVSFDPEWLMISELLGQDFDVLSVKSSKRQLLKKSYCPSPAINFAEKFRQKIKPFLPRAKIVVGEKVTIRVANHHRNAKIFTGGIIGPTFSSTRIPHVLHRLSV